MFEDPAAYRRFSYDRQQGTDYRKESIFKIVLQSLHFAERSKAKNNILNP
jgi:hypothetical protein